MKLALVTSGFPPVVDGVTVLVDHRVRWLSARGHQVTVFCPDYEPLAEVYPDWQEHRGPILPGVEVVALPSVGFFDLPYERNLGRAAHAALEAHLDRTGPDLVHVDEPDRIAMTMYRRVALSWARRHKVPCVAYHHTNWVEYTEDMPGGMPPLLVGPIRWAGKRFIRWAYSGYDATLVNGPTTQAKLISYGLDNTLCAQLCGFDHARFSPGLREPDFFARRYGIEGLGDKRVLVNVGRLTSDKGWAFFLDAFSEAASHLDLEGLALVLVGAGDMEDEIRRRLGFLPHLHLLGRRPHDEVARVLANSDLFLTASEKETFGLCVVEASASGLAVLAPRAGGVLDAVAEGRTGLLYAPGDCADFLDKLQRLLGDPDLSRELGRAGLAHAAPMSWQTTVGTWLDTVQAVARREREPGGRCAVPA